MVEFPFVGIAIKRQLPVKFHLIVYLGLTLASWDTVKYANDKSNRQSGIKLPYRLLYIDPSMHHREWTYKKKMWITINQIPGNP